MRYVIAGSSGFIGSALRDALARAGHDVVRLVRSDSPSPYDSRWDPYAGEVDLTVIEAADVVVNVAGAPIVRPWTSSVRRSILQSRVQTTATLARAIATVDSSPAFLAQSGINAYGRDRGDTPLIEDTEPQREGFMHRVTVDWEAATEAAEESGSRVCRLRTGAALDRRGGALKSMLPAFRLGLAGNLAGGDQYFPAISLDDWVGAAMFLGAHETAAGPFNLVAPDPPTNAEFTAAMGRALHRPTLVPAPAFALRFALGELADQLVASMRAVPHALESHGYQFQHRNIDEILAAALD